ncbi:prepilin peptidase [Mycobacterium mantenii]|uniref:Prepilin peptidase n=1 Tax=Mycobacterium mantenii TaxID=560555 RepID=A0A1X0FXF5_MYCNT|nr:A24 family peptidase [Mycobacterium mantenii]MCV7242745.1 prepilin peptidase [Mycobacterium mantenii]ORB06417.1 prepilin peptidase [Mycobacterium mantenii]BBY36449.1 prepilin peptidase [Mycobacterium mantenii]
MRIAAVCLVLAWLAALSRYDIRERRLPNALTLTGAAAILAIAALTGRGAPALAGTVALTAIYLMVHCVAPRGMGAGDVKLALGLGALTGCFGVGAWFLAALGAPLLTVVLAMVARLLGGDGGTAAVPHGPSMCLASAAGVGLVLGSGAQI